MALDDEDKENEEKERKIRKRRSIWVYPSLINRKTEGEYFILYPHLVDDEDKFITYFRMSTETFEMIFSKIEKRIVKKIHVFTKLFLQGKIGRIR